MTCHNNDRSYANSDSTTIYLVRHAQSVANERKRYTGWLDVPLSDEGVRQAERCRDYFKDIKIDNVYTSTLQRAYTTAQIIFDTTTNIVRLDEFKEINIGGFEDKTHAELLCEYPDIYSGWISDPVMSTPPDGETLNDFYARTIGGLIRSVTGKSVAIVTHGGVIRCLILYALSMRLNDIWRIKVDNLSVSKIELSGNKRALTLLNDTCHLKGQPVADS